MPRVKAAAAVEPARAPHYTDDEFIDTVRHLKDRNFDKYQIAQKMGYGYYFTFNNRLKRVCQAKNIPLIELAKPNSSTGMSPGEMVLQVRPDGSRGMMLKIPGPVLRFMDLAVSNQAKLTYRRIRGRPVITIERLD